MDRLARNRLVENLEKLEWEKINLIAELIGYGFQRYVWWTNKKSDYLEGRLVIIRE